jgi:hypothetical protein
MVAVLVTIGSTLRLPTRFDGFAELVTGIEAPILDPACRPSFQKPARRT